MKQFLLSSCVLLFACTAVSPPDTIVVPAPPERTQEVAGTLDAGERQRRDAELLARQARAREAQARGQREEAYGRNDRQRIEQESRKRAEQQRQAAALAASAEEQKLREREQDAERLRATQEAEQQRQKLEQLRAEREALMRSERQARAESAARVEAQQRLQAQEMLRAEERLLAQERQQSEERQQAEARLRAEEMRRAEEKLRVDEQLRADQRLLAEDRLRAQQYTQTGGRTALSAPGSEPSGFQRRDQAAEPRWSIDADGLPARDFFQGMVANTQYSVIFSPAFKGPPISANLQDVGLMEAMNTVADLYGYSVELEGRIFRISSPELQTRTYQVDYLSMTRGGRSQTLVTSGQISANEQASDGVGSRRVSSNSTHAGTQIDTAFSSKVWEELSRVMNGMINTERGEMVVLSPESGALLVRANSRAQRDIRKFLEVAHGTFHTEVLIEAKILEVTLDDTSQIGVNWAALSQNDRSSNLLGVVGGDQVFGSGVSAFANQALTIGPGNALQSIASTGAGGALVLALEYKDFSGIFEFLKSQGDIKVLSSPRVATLNNQKAVIKVGTDEFFVTGISNNTTTGNNAVTNTDIELTPFFSGVALDVTPRVFGDQEVILHVHPSVSEVTDSTKEIILQDQIQRLPLASSSLRESDSVIRARSGQIVAIGGLIREEEVDQKFTTPILGKIPLIKHLFGQTRKVRRRSELVILIRPTVRGAAVNANELDQLRQRFGGTLPTDWLE